METQPVVSVICLCYNQQDFVVAAMRSVLDQTYSPVEIIVVDDGSTDNSVTVIREFCKQHPSIRFLELRENKGNCKAFNSGFAISTGSFIIDLAADDILLPNRIEEGVNMLSKFGDTYGVHFSNAECVDRDLQHLWFHSEKISLKPVPQGDVYEDLITRYFVCSPTIMFRRSVFETLGGYDETLAFEDFDFWIRSARQFKYCYSDKVLVKKRILRKSMSDSQYRFDSRQMRTIFTVCEKIFRLNRTANEMRALKKRAYYEMRMAALTFNFKLVLDYLALIRKINQTL
jgi:glycosyltransferase involved in cell wall biosynthesis